MNQQIMYAGINAVLRVSLARGESVRAESDAMVGMTGKIVVEGKLDGGLWKSIGRSLLGGESLFVQVLTAKDESGEVILAPAIPGDIKLLPVTAAEPLYLQRGSWLASLEGTDIETAMQNLGKGIFSGAGLFVHKATGTGSVAVSTFGAVHEINVAADSEYVIDTGHLVAWNASMKYKIEKASRTWFGSAASGEWLVCRFKGPGKVWLQTRNPQAFASWLSTRMPTKSS